MSDGTIEGEAASSVPGCRASMPARLRAIPVSQMQGNPPAIVPVRTQSGLRTGNGHKRDKPRDGDIPARKGGPEAVRPLVLVSDSNGSRSVTTSATLDRWHRVSAESDSGLFAINARKSPLAWLAVGHHGKAFRVGFFTRGDRRGPDCRESDCCEAAMVRHASPAKSP